MKNFKQKDPEWASRAYAGETMASSGCGPCACADLLDESPIVVANWLTAHGYASNGSGTYHSGIVAVIKNRGFSCEKITSGSLAGKTESVHFTTLKAHLKSGKTAVLLMGGKATGCKDNRWCSGGHYIAAVGMTGEDILISDPWSSKNDGAHPWDHFGGDIKHIFLAGVKWQEDKPKEEKNLAEYWKGVRRDPKFKGPAYRVCAVDYTQIRTAPHPDAPLMPDYPGIRKGNGFLVLDKFTNNWGYGTMTGDIPGYIYCGHLMMPPKE